MKSAREMFEELGYKHSLFGDMGDKNIIYDLVNENTYIMFKISTKEIKFCGVFPNKVDSISFSMNMDLLQAINKQVEELHWNDTTVNIDVKLNGKKVMEAMRGGNNA